MDILASVVGGWVLRLVAGLLLVTGVGLLSACSADEPEPEGRESPGEEASATVASSASTSTLPAPVLLPGGPFYLPSELPDGWEISGLQFFGDAHADDLAGPDSVRLIVHRSEGGFATGGVSIAVTPIAEGQPALLNPFGMGDAELVEVPGLTGAELERIPDTRLVSLEGFVDDRTMISLWGALPVDEVVDIAAAVDVSYEGDSLRVDLDLEGWVAERSGPPGDSYSLGLRGPNGAIEVFVAPESPQSALYLHGTDFERALEGEIGVGYYAVQRIESEDLEFPSVQWWVPNVRLSSSVGPDLEVISKILDSFVEVDDATFAAEMADVPIEVIEVDPPVAESGPAPEGVPLDQDRLNELVEFVETEIGRDFTRPPTVSMSPAGELRDSIPDGAFVSEGLWDLLLVLGLVDANDDRADADAARRERVRGVCCPVTVIDTGDPAFNDVVIVHELTHGLDTDLRATGTSSEPVDPVVALVEGNAHRIAFSYADLLNEQGADIPPPPNLFPPDGDPRLPTAVQRILEFPYASGRLFTEAIARSGGEPGIVNAFERPPSTSEQIMNPEAYLQDEQPGVVPPPSIPSSAEIKQQGSLGAFLISLVAELELEPQEATDLALTWHGDRYTLYETDTELCIAAAIVFDTTDNATTMTSILEANDTQTTPESETITFTRCSPRATP